MGEPAIRMERTSTFARMWRAQASRRGGCCESRAMDRRGQASAAANCSRWSSGDRAENGCAMVPVGSGAIGGSDTRRAGNWGYRCQRRAPVVAWVGGVGRGWVRAGGRGVGEKPRQALKARRLRHA